MWVEIGKKAGWIKVAQTEPVSPTPQVTEEVKPIPSTKPTSAPFVPSVEEEIKPKEEIIQNLVTTLESATTRYGELTWLVVRNTTPDIAIDLKNLGFRPFKNRATGEWEWSLGDKKAREIRPQLDAFGLDTSALDSPPVKKERGAGSLAVAEVEDIEGTDLPAELVNWNKEMKEAKKLDSKERRKKYSDIIEAALQKIGEEVESPEVIAQSQAILKTMLQAASKFHNYSFWNSMMIAIMKPHATFVASEKAWRAMGRVPMKGATRIPVMFPFTRKLNEEQKSGLTDQQIAQATRTYFGIGSTLAYEDTVAIPDWKNKKGEGPFEPPEWQINSNEATEWLTRLYAAAYKWGTEVKKFKIETGSTGVAAGWSAGGKITIADKADGIRKVSTLFHELAHELLHWDKDFNRTESTKQEKETEAELVSYVVCSHYHIENKDTPLYLAGLKVNKEMIHARLRNVQKAAVEIFDGIDSIMSFDPVEQRKELEQGSTKEPTDYATTDSPYKPEEDTENVATLLGSNSKPKKTSAMPYFLNNYVGKLGL